MAVAGRLRRAVQKWWEGVWSATSPPESSVTLFDFSRESDCEQWSVYADCDSGGMSTATVDRHDGGGGLVLHGTLSTEVAEGSKLTKSGFAGMKSVISRNEYLPLEGMDTLCFRVRGDGRLYIVSLQTDSWLVPNARNEDLWQAPLQTGLNRLEDLHLGLDHFTRTHKGMVVNQSETVEASRVLAMGIGLAGAGNIEKPGPYRLELHSISAFNSERLPPRW